MYITGKVKLLSSQIIKMRNIYVHNSLKKIVISKNWRESKTSQSREDWLLGKLYMGSWQNRV